MSKPIVDASKCSGCGDCAFACMFDVLAIKDGVATVKSEIDCIGCEMCNLACFSNAIYVQP